MNNISKDLASYLKTKKGLTRLMNKLKEKYVLLSRSSGTIRIDNINELESIDISNLLGRKITKNDTLRTSFKEITKKINEGKYNGFDWLELFCAYFEEKIMTKEEQTLNKKQEENAFYQELYKKNKDKKYIKVLEEIIEHDEMINKIVKQKYNKNKNNLQDEINNILLLLNNIPPVPTPLAVYSSIVGNPHYLDFNKSTSTLFLKILAKIKNIQYEDKIEIKISLLSEINVYTDPISNYVITYKLIGNRILNKLNKNNEAVNLNLLNINKMERVRTDNKKVYVFENPSMLMSLMDLNVSIIITSGMPNISLYTLLQKLDESNIKIYYNGDFDPEGLLIAEKLKIKFPSIELFCYDVIDYDKAKSKEKISASRLKKLDNIKSIELYKIKKELLENKVSAYQEQNIDNIRKYIINSNF